MPPRELTESPEPELLRRLLEYGDRVGRATADRVTPLDGAHAVIFAGAPLVHHSNYVALERPGRTAAELAAMAREAMARDAISAFSVAPLDPAEGPRLEPGFRELGWKVEHGAYMVHRREPDGVGERPVQEVNGSEIEGFMRELMKETYAGDYAGDPDEVAGQIVALERAYAACGGDRWFVAPSASEPAGFCYLIEREGLGQVENVATAPAHRDRGIGRSVVLAAVEASRRSGNELTFIGAEADDWPWKLYRRLGFDPVGIETVFVTGAPEAGNAQSP